VSDRLGRARERVEEIERRQPQAAELAKLASLAVRIEPELLRTLRLRVAPHLDVGAEADLWFSPLVQARGVDGITFSAEVAEILREWLRTDKRLPRVWKEIEECHRTISPALRLEEKVAWLALNDAPVEEIEKALAPALVALFKEGRTGIAAWAARALPHLPVQARSTRVAWVLNFKASRSLAGRMILEEGAPVDLLEEDLTGILPDLGEVDLGVRRHGGELDLGDLQGEGVSTIRVGDTVPRLVEVRWQERGEEQREVVGIKPGSIVQKRVGLGDVRLRALNGSVYVLHRVPERSNPAVEALRKEWDGITSPRDSRLPGFLDKLQKSPALLAELAVAVARGLRVWFGRETEKIRISLAGAGPAPDEAGLGDMERLARQVTAIATLEPELTRELQEFRRERFRQLSSEILGASRQWEVGKAWELIKRLEDSGESDPGLDRLADAANQADELFAEVSMALDRWPADMPRHWAELRVVLESLGKARQYLGDSRIPGPWHDKIRQRSGALVTGALDFLRRQATAAATLEELRELGSQYQRLQPASIDASLADRPEWYEPALESLGQEAAGEARAAEEAEDLESLAQRLGLDSNSVPPTVSARLNEWRGWLRRIAASWRSMAQGEEFSPPDELPAGPPSFLPEGFVTTAPRFQAALAELRQALAGLDEEGSLQSREAACQEALETARRVLDETPEHDLAQHLYDKAEERRVHLRLDEALRGWDPEKFLDSARLGLAEESYQRLAEAGGVIRELAGLVSAPALTTSGEAARWWRRWRNAAASLPAGLPGALREAIDREEERRRGQWISALDRLLQSQPSPETCREEAELLAELRSIPGLAGYHEELTQRARAGSAERWIADGNWSEAEKELEALAGRVADHRRLSCRLAVGRASAAGPAALADVLARGWPDVLTTFGNEAYSLLETALTGVWERGETEALRRLGEIVRRVARIADLPPEMRSRFQDWLRWLQVERALEEKISASSLRQLVSYARENPSLMLHARLRSWVGRWRRQDETVALAWAFQTFPDLFLPGETDPAQDLAVRGREIAERVLRDLRTRADLDLPHLRELRQQIETCERDWRDLDDYLSFVDHPVERPSLPEVFQQARALLEGLLHAVDAVERLESADLRQREAQASWRSTRLDLLQDLRDLPVAEGLRQRVDQLFPLTRFFEGSFREMAQACDDPEKLDDKELFAHAAGWLRDLIGRFEGAGRVGGAMWELLSSEYWQQIPRLAGDLQTPPPVADLEALARRFEAMESEERDVRRALLQLHAEDPPVSSDGPFFPELHRAYLDLYPRTRPGSRRVFRLFDRFAKVGTRPVILRECVGHLPAWIADYLHRGVP